mmetsp:Transcript_77193/g.136086  ORF Transcript_77193/g.136086 Transcript_77193/m.136086 type:complete len:216 (-) Transcript_77193:118-765(-)
MSFLQASSRFLTFWPPSVLNRQPFLVWDSDRGNLPNNTSEGCAIAPPVTSGPHHHAHSIPKTSLGDLLSVTCSVPPSSPWFLPTTPVLSFLHCSLAAANLTRHKKGAEGVCGSIRACVRIPTSAGLPPVFLQMVQSQLCGCRYCTIHTPMGGLMSLPSLPWVSTQRAGQHKSTALARIPTSVHCICMRACGELCLRSNHIKSSPCHCCLSPSLTP